jgi:hypothetical protein
MATRLRYGLDLPLSALVVGHTGDSHDLVGRSVPANSPKLFTRKSAGKPSSPGGYRPKVKLWMIPVLAPKRVR